MGCIHQMVLPNESLVYTRVWGLREISVAELPLMLQRERRRRAYAKKHYSVSRIIPSVAFSGQYNLLNVTYSTEWGHPATSPQLHVLNVVVAR